MNPENENEDPGEGPSIVNFQVGDASSNKALRDIQRKVSQALMAEGQVAPGHQQQYRNSGRLIQMAVYLALWQKSYKMKLQIHKYARAKGMID